MNNRKQITYAYLVTSLGVVLAIITTAYTTIRSLFAPRRFHSEFNSGNFTRTATNQFGNFTGTRPFGNPYGGFVNGLTILAVIIAIVGVLWLGISLKKAQVAKM